MTNYFLILIYKQFIKIVICLTNPFLYHIPST